MSPATKHFIRHYVEMVIAMFLGMRYRGHAWRPNAEMAASA
jgi:hypothetical protein